MDEPLPTGMALRVPLPDSTEVAAPVQNYDVRLQTAIRLVLPALPVAGPDGLVNFDDLSLPMVCVNYFPRWFFLFVYKYRYR